MQNSYQLNASLLLCRIHQRSFPHSLLDGWLPARPIPARFSIVIPPVACIYDVNFRTTRKINPCMYANGAAIICFYANYILFTLDLCLCLFCEIEMESCCVRLCVIQLQTCAQIYRHLKVVEWCAHTRHWSCNDLFSMKSARIYHPPGGSHHYERRNQ